MSAEVEAYIYSFEDSLRDIFIFLDDLLVNEYGLESKIRYKVPFYYGKSWICYLNPIKNEKVELAFLRGNELSDSQGLLDFKKRKQVAGIDIVSVEEVDVLAIRNSIEEAIFLDETISYKSKRT